MELKLYSREWCSWCIDAKDYLSEKGYRFQEIDVGKDRRAYEDMKILSAQTYVPAFVAGGERPAHSDLHLLRKFLNRHQMHPSHADALWRLHYTLRARTHRRPARTS